MAIEPFDVTAKVQRETFLWNAPTRQTNSQNVFVWLNRQFVVFEEFEKFQSQWSKHPNRVSKKTTEFVFFYCLVNWSSSIFRDELWLGSEWRFFPCEPVSGLKFEALFFRTQKVIKKIV